MFLSKKILGLCVLAVAAVGTIAASPAQAGTYRRSNTVVVYRDTFAPRAAISFRVNTGHTHHVKRDRFHDRRDFRRDHDRRWRHRHDHRRGRC